LYATISVTGAGSAGFALRALDFPAAAILNPVRQRHRGSAAISLPFGTIANY
jgi:hypothetical protein